MWFSSRLLISVLNVWVVVTDVASDNTLNGERFAGLMNFYVFHSFQEYRKSFPFYIIQASYNGIV